MENKTDRMNRKHLRKKNALPLRGMALVLCLVLLLPMLFACTTPEEGTTPAATTPAETTVTTPSTTTLDAAQLLERDIKEAYYRTHTDAAGAEVSVVIHEQFDDIYVVETTKDATVLDLEYEIVANREFLYDTEARLEVYRADGDGTLIPLAEAHASGLLTDEQIRTLYDTFRDANKAFYDEYSPEKQNLISEGFVPPHDNYRYNEFALVLRPFAYDVEIRLEDFACVGATQVSPALPNQKSVYRIKFPGETPEDVIEAMALLEDRCEILGLNPMYFPNYCSVLDDSLALTATSNDPMLGAQ